MSPFGRTNNAETIEKLMIELGRDPDVLPSQLRKPENATKPE